MVGIERRLRGGSVCLEIKLPEPDLHQLERRRAQRQQGPILQNFFVLRMVHTTLQIYDRWLPDRKISNFSQLPAMAYTQ